jgi:hypothetical protein
MTVATVTPIRRPPGQHLIAVRVLSRAERRTELERLAEDATLSVPPSDRSRGVLLAAYACPGLTPEQAEAKWDDYIGEVRRVQSAEAGEPDFRDLEPELAQADCVAALNDILDGTETYRCQR